MKFPKYTFFFLAVLVVILTLALIVYKTKPTENAVVITPVPETTIQQTSVFSLENAPSEALRGQITTMTGEVNWQGRIATEAAKLSSPITVQQGEKLSTGENSNLSLIFSNACSVKFSEDTEIEIIQTLPANIVFSQTNGTGEYAKTGSYPVSIRALNLLANVDGDALLSINPKKPVITLTLKSGKATVAYNDLRYISHEVNLTARHTFTFNSGTRRGVLK